MAFTNEEYLPAFEELTVPEIQLSSVALRAGAHYFGKYCDAPCKEFMLCSREERDPRKCLAEGKEVTRCGIEFYAKVKKNCYEEFTTYMECLDGSDRQMSFKNCRKTQGQFDHCMRTRLGQERPDLGYFAKVRIHHTDRAKPEPKPHELPERIPDPPDFACA